MYADNQFFGFTRGLYSKRNFARIDTGMELETEDCTQPDRAFKKLKFQEIDSDVRITLKPLASINYFNVAQSLIGCNESQNFMQLEKSTVMIPEETMMDKEEPKPTMQQYELLSSNLSNTLTRLKEQRQRRIENQMYLYKEQNKLYF